MGIYQTYKKSIPVGIRLRIRQISTKSRKCWSSVDSAIDNNFKCGEPPAAS